MDIMGYVYPLITAYDLLESVKDKRFNKQVSGLIAQEQAMLKSLISLAEKGNLSDTRAIERVNNIINDLSNLRQVINPSMLSKIDQGLREARRAVSDYSDKINTRNKIVNTAQASQTAATSTRGNINMSGITNITKSLNEMGSIPKGRYFNLEQSIKGDKENV